MPHFPGHSPQRPTPGFTFPSLGGPSPQRPGPSPIFTGGRPRPGGGFPNLPTLFDQGGPIDINRPGPIDPGFNVPPPGGRNPIPRPGEPGFNPGSAGIGPVDGDGAPETGGGGFIDDLLGSETGQRANFFSRVNELGGRNTAIGRFNFDRFQDFQDRFLGQLGSQLREGQEPTKTFGDFLENFDFQREFRSFAPSLRGQGVTARFRPSTQFQF